MDNVYEITCIQGIISDVNLLFILGLIDDYVSILEALDTDEKSADK